MNTARMDALKAALDRMVGLTCWAAVGAVGSHVSLKIGGKIQRDIPIKNPNISALARKYTGEWGLFIQDCTWRVDSSRRVLASSRSTCDKFKSICTRLTGRTIVEAVLIRPAGDLVVTFDKNLTLRLFADCIDARDGTNYTLFTPTKSITVTHAGRIRTEKRNP